MSVYIKRTILEEYGVASQPNLYRSVDSLQFLVIDTNNSDLNGCPVEREDFLFPKKPSTSSHPFRYRSYVSVGGIHASHTSIEHDTVR